MTGAHAISLLFKLLECIVEHEVSEMGLDDLIHRIRVRRPSLLFAKVESKALLRSIFPFDSDAELDPNKQSL